jgi:opacity protein-like surface antigen
MKRGIALAALLTALTAAVAAAALVGAIGPSTAGASSHREAPLISDDPAADNTDVYAFVSPDKPDTVTIIANYIPLEDPAGGPNYYRFDPTARYELHVDNDGDARDDVTYRFEFQTNVGNPNTFLYNTNQVTSPTDPDLNVKQEYSVTRIAHGSKTVLGSHIPVTPANIGPRSNPTYDALQGVVDLGSGRKVFAGPRDDPFFVDLGSIFDLAGLRPFNMAHLIPLATEAGKDGVLNYNTHAIAIQVPKTDLLPAPKADGTIGIYASASRKQITILRGNGTIDTQGPWVQVSRLGNPLINEVVIPLGKKDLWNASSPRNDSQFAQYYTSPELAGLVNLLYPVTPDVPTSGRSDLVAVLLTGVPGLNFTGNQQADLLRLNTAIAPTASPSPLGALAGDFQGFPNGRRLADDVTDIEIRAVACGYGPILAGALGLCNLAPNNALSDGVDANENAFLSTFPYVAAPNRGYEHTGHK